MKPTDALSVKSAEGLAAPAGLTGAPPRRRKESVGELLAGLKLGDRGALSRAITLVESAKPSDHRLASELLDRTLQVSESTVRVGITGAPGVGKSTLIEALGLHVVSRGSRLAVLTVDPSSASTHGSILGDKSRMARLSILDAAFIRPSPSGCRLGGVANQTREAIQLCEAAGFDVVFVETVGVGQSETEVRGMVDCFLLLAMAGAGDELQGIKRGIMELADLIALTKADGENHVRAEVAAGQIERALMLTPPNASGRRAHVRLCSALESSGISELWDDVRRVVDDDRASGRFTRRRRDQSIAWMHELVRQSILDAWLRRADVRTRLDALADAVGGGRVSARAAANELVSAVE